MKNKDAQLLEEAYEKVNELKMSEIPFGVDRNGKKIYKGTKIKNLENGLIGIAQSWYMIDGESWINYDAKQGDKEVRIRDYITNFEVVE